MLMLMELFSSIKPKEMNQEIYMMSLMEYLKRDASISIQRQLSNLLQEEKVII